MRKASKRVAVVCSVLLGVCAALALNPEQAEAGIGKIRATIAQLFGGSVNVSGAISDGDVLTFTSGEWGASAAAGGGETLAQTLALGNTAGTDLLADAGTVTVPGIAWASDDDGTGTGFYRPGADEIDASINGVSLVHYEAGLAYFEANVQLPDGRILYLGDGQDLSFSWSTAQTPDAATLGIFRLLLVVEAGDEATDFGVTQPANPTIVIQSSDETTPTERALLDWESLTIGGATSTGIRLDLEGAGTILAIREGDDSDYRSIACNSVNVDGSVNVQDFGRVNIGSGSDAFLEWSTGQTNDALQIATDSQSRTVLLIDRTQAATDYNFAQQSNPTLHIHSAAAQDADHFSLQHNQTNAVLWTGEGGFFFTTDGSTQDGDILAGTISVSKEVEDLTADNVLLGSETNKVLTNLGDAGLQTQTLPGAATVGTTYTFFVAAAFEMRVDPGASDKLIDADNTGLVDGEYITNSTVGGSITLVALSDGDWMVTHSKGTWTEETP